MLLVLLNQWVFLLNTFGTSKVSVSDGEIAKVVEEIFDMRPYFIEKKIEIKKSNLF